MGRLTLARESPARRRRRWTSSASGADCNDGNDQTLMDQCNGFGECVGVNPCESNPCTNGGTCHPFGNGTFASFSCECDVSGPVGGFCNSTATEEASFVVSLSIEGDCPPSNETAYAEAFTSDLSGALGLDVKPEITEITCE